MSIYTVEDFRIGNIVKQGRITEIFLDDCYRIKVAGNPYAYNTVELDYEPITPEWLERFGFIKHQYHFYSKNGVTLGYLTTDDWFQYEKNRSEFTDVKYIHQLQNLYHALTGKELTPTP